MKKNSKNTIFNLNDSERETLHSAWSIFHELVELINNEENAKGEKVKNGYGFVIRDEEGEMIPIDELEDFLDEFECYKNLHSLTLSIEEVE